MKESKAMQEGGGKPRPYGWTGISSLAISTGHTAGQRHRNVYEAKPF